MQLHGAFLCHHWFHWLLFTHRQPYLRWNFISRTRTPHAIASLLPPHTAQEHPLGALRVFFDVLHIAPAPAHASTEHVHSSSAQPGTPEPHTRREPAVSAASLRLALPHCPQTPPHSLSASTTSMESRVELLGHPQRGASCGQRLAVQYAPCESTHARARPSGMHDSVHTQPSTDHSSHITSSCYYRTTISKSYITDMSLSNRTYICDPSASPDLPPPDKTN
jgi:hypothetical protein